MITAGLLLLLLAAVFLRTLRLQALQAQHARSWVRSQTGAGTDHRGHA